MIVEAVVAEDLSRTFNGRRAVDGLTFSVEEGEIFGFLGPNGAGKTTTIRLLTGQLRPTSGRARVADCDVVRERDRLKSRIGVVFEYPNLYERLSGRENLAFMARLYGLDRPDLERAKELYTQAMAVQERLGNKYNSQFGEGTRTVRRMKAINSALSALK